MKCPFCDADQLIVTNSRPTNSDLEIWRRRKCLSCGGIITTHEKIDLSYITVVKKSGKHVKYNRAKLYSSIYHAIAGAKKMDRGTAGDISEKLMQRIEKDILALRQKEITSADILNLTANEIKKDYPDSFLRYIAYFNSANLQPVLTNI